MIDQGDERRQRAAHRGRVARPLRLAIVDDNPFVAAPDGTIRPVAALFHPFAAAVVAAGPFEPARYLIPVRRASRDAPLPGLPAVDEARLRVVPTAPFAGAADYLRRLPRLTRANAPVLRSAIADADLVWIKTPASNALLAALLAHRARTARFAWVAGSTREVIGAQRRRGAEGLAAGCAGILYDAVTRLLERTGPAVRLGPELFTSTVTSAELLPVAVPLRRTGPWTVVWAGRVAPEKGLIDLIEALAIVRTSLPDLRLTLIGDGPARAAVEAQAARLGLDGQVTWTGYLGDRDAYLSALRAADLFLLPSHTEGVPKVLLEAMAAGVPVVATHVGGIPRFLGDRGRLVPPRDPAALAAAILELLGDARERERLRDEGLTWAASRTIEAQAARLVSWMRRSFPSLPWLPA